MAYIDEKIARLEKAVRVEEREEQEKKRREQEKKEREKEQPGQEDTASEPLTLEKVRQQIKQGSITLGGKSFRFSPKEYLNGAVSWIDIEGRLEKEEQTAENGDQVLILTGIQDELQLYVACTKNPGRASSIEEQEKALVKTYRELGLYARVEKRETGSHFDYLTFFVPSGKGKIYGFAFWQKSGEKKRSGSFTCLYEEKETTGLLLEALLLELDEKNE